MGLFSFCRVKLLPHNKRRLVVIAVVVTALFGLAMATRPWLAGFAIRTALGLAGATEIKFRTVAATPWNLVVENLEFRLKAQVYAAHRLTLDRPRWWRFSLGKVQIEGARMALTIDGSDTNPWAWSTYQGGAEPAKPMSLPVESLVLDGEMIVRAAAQPDQRLVVKLEGEPKGKSDWVGSLVVDGPGFKLAGGGTLLGRGTELDFQVHSADLDLKIWQGFIQRNLALPGGRWELGGRLTGVAEGHVTAKRFAATARVSLRAGRAVYAERAIAVEGIEADLEFSDLWKFHTKLGTLRIRELHTGKLPLRDFVAEFAFEGADLIHVSHASLRALGGSVAVEPFKYVLSRHELDAVVLVEGISVGEVMDLTEDLPAKATGRVNGRFPLWIDGAGVRLGTGWLELQPGIDAEIQFNASGLLTRGMAPKSPSYTVLQKIESGLLKLRISELRLDIRPPNVPPGRSAQLHIVGEPVDPEVKAPVTLDLNVNGPLERLLNMGMDSRLNFGTKP